MRIAKEALAEIRAHAAEGYPHEICGILFGPRGNRQVSEVTRAHNLIIDRANDRYEIDPRDLIRAQREADQRDMDVIGYYHSHPDHPARPSIFDAERAWAGPLYVIASCNGGVTEAVNGFIAEKDGGPFREEALEVDE